MRLWSLLLTLSIAACATSVVEEPPMTVPATAGATAATVAASTSTLPPTTTTTIPTTTTTSPFARPDWLGTRLLPLRPDGHGEIRPTPPELFDRRLETIDVLDPPESDVYIATIEPVPPEVIARSSWSEECPVTLDELRYLTISHHGFDGEIHTGEMIVNARFAKGVTEVFGDLFEAEFPIEQMRVIRIEEVDDHPTGDFNDTTSFVCRPAVGSDNWSYHAYGLAIDVNPFHNPYLRDDLVIPELASAYTDRDVVRPGMIFDGDVVVEAFAEIGWSWGGHWNTLKDWMHFSSSGR